MTGILIEEKNDSTLTKTRILGKVIRGNQIGRTIGFPTANLLLNEGVFLQKGVYGVHVFYQNQLYYGLMNVGVRPTVNKEEINIHYEVHIFDFDQMIYDEELDVEVCYFVREEQLFSSMKNLVLQIRKDVETVQRMFNIVQPAIVKKEIKPGSEEYIHLTDLAFIQLCDDKHGINRGVYNTIDTWIYKQGIKNILERRRLLLTFLESIKDCENSRKKFGPGGLTPKLEEFFYGNVEGKAASNF
ncbi:riboflavin kinase [Neobacillus sp. NPDC097160]|uniref:riboflavin kinase n=1 Tax=Neobacillus sp. NPDC097160 TaxID=3364298 RepID=UPI003815DC5C